MNWAIVSTGRIANDFSNALRQSNSNIVAVCSRSKAKAENFVNSRCSNAKAFDSLDEMLKMESIDIVYIGSPHPFHCEATLKCIEAGKNVVCEKPLTVDAVDAKHILRAQKKKKVFVTECMWTRAFPATKNIILRMRNNEIGKILAVQGTFGFQDDGSAERLTALKDAGGAVLDIGVYLLAFASLAFGGFQNVENKPELIKCSGILNEEKTDSMTSISLQLSGGRTASLVCSIQCALPNRFVIIGTKGCIQVEQFWCPLEFNINGKQETFEASQKIDAPYFFPRSEEFQHEIEHVEEMIKQGKQESDLMPLNETLAIIEIMDECRKQINYGL